KRMASATSVKLDDDMKGRVQHLAEMRKRTPHRIMREAIAQYVEREEKREAFRQETLAAWQEYQETGLHATAKEVSGGWKAGALIASAPPPNATGDLFPAAIRDLRPLRDFLRPKNAD